MVWGPREAKAVYGHGEVSSREHEVLMSKVGAAIWVFVPLGECCWV